MTDIIDRLRNDVPWPEIGKMRKDALNEIERLRAERDALRAAGDRLVWHARHSPACPNSIQAFPEACLCECHDAIAAWWEVRGDQ